MAENPTSYEDTRNLDENGVPYGIKHVNNKPQVLATPFLYDVTRGAIPGKSKLHKFGANGNIGAAEEIVMSQGGMINYLTGAEIPKIKSSDTDDDGDPEGAGAWTVQVGGLDANYDEQEETVTLNGTTLVALENSYIRVFWMYLVTASNPVTANVGIITLYQNDGTTPMIEMVIGRGQSQFCAYTVPNGKTYYLTSFGISEVNNKRVRARLYTRDTTLLNSAFRLRDELVALAGSSDHHLETPDVIAEKTDIELRGASDTTASDVTGYFHGWLE